jgi:poly(hydroxyalkanoate) granule-associated protein
MNIKQIREVAQDLPNEVVQAGRQVWLAGLGAAGIVTTGGEAVLSMLVEEGKRVKKLTVADMSGVLDNVVDSAVTPVKAAVDRLDTTVQQTTRTVLARIGLPSRQEVSALTTRVEQLITKVESLNVRKPGRGVKKGARRGH